MKNPKVGEKRRKRYKTGTFIDGDILYVDGDVVTVQWDSDKLKCPTYKTIHHRTHLIRLKKKEKRVVEFECEWVEIREAVSGAMWLSPSFKRQGVLPTDLFDIENKRTKVRVTVL